MDTVVFNKVATFNIDFASHDSKNRMNKTFDSQLNENFIVLKSRWLCLDLSVRTLVRRAVLLQES